jgi:hypothetical protein
MKKADRNDVASVKLVTREIDDHAKVRIGGQIPLFSPVPGPAHCRQGQGPDGRHEPELRGGPSHLSGAVT